MQSSPNGMVKKLKSLDQGSNDIYFFLYFLNVESKEENYFFYLVSLLATMHQTRYKLNLHAFPITYFF